MSSQYRSSWVLVWAAASVLLAGACTSDSSSALSPAANGSSIELAAVGDSDTSTPASITVTTAPSTTTTPDREDRHELLELIDESAGLRVAYPAGWHPSSERLSRPVGDEALRELLVLGTGDLGTFDEACPSAPAAALASMQPDDVLLWLVEWEPIFLELEKRPERLPTFISDGSLADCARATQPMARDWEFLRWSEQGRGLWMVVAYGADTTTVDHDEVWDIVQHLEFVPEPGEAIPAAFDWPSGWSETPGHEVTGRVFPSIVWTGTEYIVWGGEKPSETGFHATGAAFNPVMRRWRSLAPSPLAARSEHVGVWTGTEVLICCGRQVGSGASAGAYDPVMDRWREIEQAPIAPVFAEAVWTGEEMAVFGGVAQGGVGNLQGAAAYNPATDTWRNLADLPYGLERTADAVMGNTFIYVWPSTEGAPSPLRYDLAADTWEPLPPLADSVTPITPSVAWTGDQLIGWGLAPGGFDEDTGIGVRYDPDGQTWVLLEPAPLKPTSTSEGTQASQGIVWTGSEVVVWTGWIGTDWDAPDTRVVSYDPQTDSWRELEPAPVAALGMWHDPLIWTGTQLIAYGDQILVYTP